MVFTVSPLPQYFPPRRTMRMSCRQFEFPGSDKKKQEKNIKHKGNTILACNKVDNYSKYK